MDFNKSAKSRVPQFFDSFEQQAYLALTPY